MGIGARCFLFFLLSEKIKSSMENENFGGNAGGEIVDS